MSSSAYQRKLFDEPPLPSGLESGKNLSVASIVFSEPPYGPYDYLVPDALQHQIQPGMRVAVPFARRKAPKIGWCVGINAEKLKTDGLREILSLVDHESVCERHLVELALWMAEYYHNPPAVVLDTLIPLSVRKGIGTKEQVVYSLLPLATDEKVLQGLSVKQKRVIEELRTSGESLRSRDLAKRALCTESPIRSLVERGLLKASRERISRDDFSCSPSDVHHIKVPIVIGDLSIEQKQSLSAIDSAVIAKAFKAFLLHGVTGSGKTEVYMRSIDSVLKSGRTAIVLVPEISLAPQTLSIFAERFQNVLILHSQMSVSERYLKWNDIRKGKVDVVIGPRSALFSPMPRLGIIIIDEEHDSSFKQNSQPRYHARRVAYELAKLLDIPIILGSATPSIETYYAAKSGQIQLLSMPSRILNRPMPKVELVDLRSKEESGVGVLSRTLVEGIHNAFNANGQVMLLLNRRGFSTQIQCSDCGQTVSCPNCDLPLTYHKEGAKALCHYCNYNVTSPKTCPNCGSKTIRYTGTGTQKLEAQIRASFPGVEIARLDSDTAGKLGQHEKILSKFRAGQVKILLGTQMIAKGLDFPNVLTVGVINADNALHFPDFRAAERAFQLITQVAGRAGRGNRPGRVIVQTFNPEHYALVLAADHNYSAFYDKEIIERKKLSYPPFSRLARILLRGFSQQIIESYAQAITRKIESKFKELGAHIRVLGPASPPIEKIKNKFRIHVIVLCEDSKALKEAIGQACSVAINSSKNQVELIIDVDAVDML